MPAGMPGIVSKGYIIQKIDETLKDAGPTGTRLQLYERLVKRKSNGQFKESLIEIASDTSIVDLRPSDIDHLQDHWFNLGGGYWPRHQPTDIVVRHGLIQTIDIARPTTAGDPHLPIDCYWVCTGNAFEVTSCIGPGQVTMMILTPPPPLSDRIPAVYDGWSDKDQIYTARPRSRGPGEHQVKLDEDHVEFVQPLRE